MIAYEENNELRIDKDVDKCPFLQFLINSSIFDGKLNKEVLLSKLKAIGYMMISYHDSQIIPALVLVGPEKSGKTLFTRFFENYFSCVHATCGDLRGDINDYLADGNVVLVCSHGKVDPCILRMYLSNSHRIIGKGIKPRLPKIMERLRFIFDDDIHLTGDIQPIEEALYFWKIQFSDYYSNIDLRSIDMFNGKYERYYSEFIYDCIKLWINDIDNFKKKWYVQ